VNKGSVMKLIFVYNADSGLVNTIKDMGHKVFNPRTYDCLLCSLTHGTFRELPEWKRFRERSTIPMEFLHRDEFEAKYGKKMQYPIVLQEAGDLEVVISRRDMALFASLDELMAAVAAVQVREPGVVVHD
jgi:hypothetical protein